MTKHSPYKREKIYLKGNIFPDIRVGMQRVILTPTVETIDNKQIETENQPICIYDTGGPYTDPSIQTDISKGIATLRKNWIDNRHTKSLCFLVLNIVATSLCHT